jgi:hypothetical protein
VAEVSLDHGMTVVHVVVNEAMLMVLRLPCLVPQHCPNSLLRARCNRRYAGCYANHLRRVRL